MTQDKEVTFYKLSELWRNADVPLLDTKNEKYFIISDLHLGDGRGADNFRENEEALETALENYQEDGYKLILLGDIEEFWQFEMASIVDRYENSIYKKIQAFGDENIYRVFGNHDMEWRALPDPAKNKPTGDEIAVEAIKMKNIQGNVRILLVHGHQGSSESDRHYWSSRFLVRLFRLVEPIMRKLGFFSPPPFSLSKIKKDYEQILYSWAKRSNVILICGHSHRAIFAAKSYPERLKEKILEIKAEMETYLDDEVLIKKNRVEIDKLRKRIKKEKNKGRYIDSTESEGEPSPCYFNTGCALYRTGITGIEIADDTIKLVKWHSDPKKRPRFEIYEEGNLSAYSTRVSSLEI